MQEEINLERRHRRKRLIEFYIRDAVTSYINRKPIFRNNEDL